MSMTGDVGKIYADALFELGREDNTLDEIYKTLNECRNVFRANPDLLKLMSAPSISADEKTDILSKIFSDCGMIYNLLCILAEKNRSEYIASITETFNNLYNEYNNIAEMTVITCIPLDNSMRERLRAKLSAKFGKTVKFKEEIDRSIIGGIIVKYGNLQMDNSVRTKLESVRHELIV